MLKISSLLTLLLLLVLNTGFAQTKISGIVNSQDGPIPFATVRIKGLNIATQTDVNGAFTLTLKDSICTLVAAAVGYQSQTLKIRKHQFVKFNLKMATHSLQEVVVIGYGSRKISENDDYAPSFSRPAPPVLLDKSKTPAPKLDEGIDREGYGAIHENGFYASTQQPLSTFSIDVDAASYSNVRRLVKAGQVPPSGAVRIEELINYFKYNYQGPADGTPFAVHTEVAACPWNTNHQLMLVGLQGRKVETANLPPSNLVFLVDVSGSMESAEKLPLVQQSLLLLTNQLREQDQVAIVTYAGNAGLVLPSTSGANKDKIRNAINNLRAGGSTAGGAGIELAYTTAKGAFKKGGNNRVILCTDGDFNVGVSSDAALVDLIEAKRSTGIYLSVLGFGMGNYQDDKMQQLADKGNGNHAYIDGIDEAKKVLVNEFGGTLFTIAKDVKLQIEFNPRLVQGYRLIGYENRLLEDEDFNDDTKDAGELGSGHTVTALYEIVPVGVTSSFLKKVDTLKYQSLPSLGEVVFQQEMANIKLRYKMPDGDSSLLLVHPVAASKQPFYKASENFRFAASVAAYGMLMRKSAFVQSANFSNVFEWASNAIGKDKEGYRAAFLQLIGESASLVEPGKYSDDDLTLQLQ